MSSRPTIGTLVGEYRLVERIGAGGMGEVFRAEHVASGQAAAVKVFALTAVNARDLARFYQEARVHQSLVHLNIAECRELVTVDGTPCLVMEFLAGQSLAEIIAQRGRLDADDALRVIQSVALAVAHAHAHGVIHRDIKPANVRLTATGQAKLLDFGIAKTAAVKGLTAAGSVIGTPHYLSPEQLLGSAVTPAADVWSLGVLLHEMITGQLPFFGDTPEALWTEINSTTPTLPGTGPAIAQANRILELCLVRDPKHRRLTAPKLAAMAIERPSAGDVFPRVTRRTMLVGVAVVVVALIGAALIWPSDPAIPNSERGTHVIDSNRQAAVFINGRAVGSTPFEYHGRIGTTIDVRVDPGDEPAQSAQIQVTSVGTTTFTFSGGRGRP